MGKGYFENFQQVPCPSGQIGYDPGAAWWLAHCSKLTYENKTTVRRELAKAKFQQVFFFDMRGTQGFLALHPGQDCPFAVVAFRGTEKNYLDILTDILILKSKLPDSEDKPPLEKTAINYGKPNTPVKLFAHGGFMEAFAWVWGTALPDDGEDAIPARWVGSEGVSNLIQQQIHTSGMPLYVTGHSLGGALATLTAYHALLHHNNVHVYTFGCPRVANRQLAEQMDAKLPQRAFRCVHGWDIVPRIPPLFSYHHAKDLVFFNRRFKRIVPESRQLTDTLIIGLCLGEVLLSAVLAVLLFPIPNRLEGMLAKAVSGGKRKDKVYAPITTDNHRIDCYIKAVEKELGF